MVRSFPDLQTPSVMLRRGPSNLPLAALAKFGYDRTHNPRDKALIRRNRACGRFRCFATAANSTSGWFRTFASKRRGITYGQ